MTDILDQLKKLYDERGQEVEQWLGAKRAEAEPFFYSSVDLRHSGLRLVPVDTNLYPAGFNNLSPAARHRASRFISRFLEENFPQAKKILIVPENHTRNMGYLENLATLMTLFENIDMEVQLGSLAAPAGAPIELESPSGRKLTEYPLVRSGDQLALENGFVPDVIIINNDMTAGIPDILQGVKQPMLPPVEMGWYQRRKNIHFDAYKKLVEDFSSAFGLDPWLFCAEFHHAGIVDFKERAHLDRVAKNIEDVLARVRAKYAQYGITDEPYVYIKADSGTYGMGIMTVRSGAEILELNKKDRNKMQVIKEGTRNSEVIIQEGVPTIDLVDGKPAEPMVYMIDGIPVGGMYRVNSSRDAYENLNASGMEFTGMCDEMEDECGKWKAVQDCNFRSFGLIAALAALAAAREDYSSSLDGAGI